MPRNGSAEVRLDLLRRLDPVVEVLEEEREAERQRRSRRQRSRRQVALTLRQDRRARHLGRVDHADVAGLQLARDAVSFVRCSRLS